MSYARLAPKADPAAYLSQIRQPISTFNRPRVVLIAWGSNPANAAAAMVRAERHAEEFGYGVLERFASYTAQMRDAILFGPTATGYERREVEYGAAWWLVRHSAVRPTDLEYARHAQRRMGAVDDERADAFQAEYGYPAESVTLGRERLSERLYPFPARPRVIDRKTGLVALPERFRAGALGSLPSRGRQLDAGG